MKIQFLLTQDLESPAGVGRYFPWARELTRLGHTVSIAALHSNYASLRTKRFVQEGVEVNYVAQMHVQKQNTVKTYYPGYRLIGIASRATIELMKIAWKSNADIIQVGKPHPMNGLAGLISRYLKRRKVFLDCDDFEMANIRFGAGWQKIGVNFFETILPKSVDYVSVNTTFLREKVIRLGVHPKKIIYLPHGSDHERFQRLDPARVDQIQKELHLENRQVVVFIGSLSLPSHPVDLLLDAFLQVHTAKPNTILLIVGGGEEYDHLVARTHWLDLDDAVIFRGRVPGSDVPIYYKLANVSAEPVTDNLVGRSSLPLKMFESWIMGVPFITQDVGDRRMVMGEPPAGLVAQAGDPNSLAQSIISVLSNPELSSLLIQRGFEQAKRYSWENLARQMEAAYQAAITEKHEHST